MELILENIVKSYGKKSVLQNTGFTFGNGKIYGLLGRNGAGKTTLFNGLSGETKLDGGHELNTKNPFFYLFSWLVSGIFVLSISLRPDPAVFSMSAAAIALIYLVAALPLVRKYASRTFRVK